MKKRKQRLDIALFERGLVPSREAGRRMIMAGQILVGTDAIIKPAVLVDFGSVITIKGKPRYVSRGGEKLKAAVDHFGIQLSNLVCADVGASTGGFTDCLLQSGVAKVYAIDVGYGQLAWSIRMDRRVVVMERTNARTLMSLPEQIDFVCIDASFISLKLLLPVIFRWLKPDAQAIALIKPQFEAGRGKVGKGGVVRDREVHKAVLIDMIQFAADTGFGVGGVVESPLRGPAGNTEFLIWLWRSNGGPKGNEGLTLPEVLSPGTGQEAHSHFDEPSSSSETD